MATYKTSNLTEEQFKILEGNNSYKEMYEDVKLLSDDFTTEDELALSDDQEIYEWIIKVQKYKQTLKNKSKKPTTKPSKTNTSTKSKTGTSKGKKTQSSTKTTKPSSVKTGKKDEAELVKELLETIKSNQGGNIDAEQVEQIIENVLNNRKICFEDLCDELSESINKTQMIQMYLPDGTKSKKSNNEIPNFQKVVDDVLLGNNVMLIGGAGTGKTFLAEEIAKFLVLETEVINCNQFTSPIEINGGQTIEGYQEGKLIKAWKDGKLLILDELPKLDPNTAGILNEALAKTNVDPNSDRAYIVNTRGDRFKKKEGFGVIATGNVYPNTESNAYGANNKQDLSLLDRFGGSIYEIEKNPDFEKKQILPGHLFIWAITDKIRTLIETNKWEAQVSIRLMQTSLRVYQSEMKKVKSGVSESQINQRKTYKDVIDSFIWTFSDVQQKEIAKAIQYDKYFKNHQYRDIDIDKNPFK
jgi:cobaltochelatase CobS